MEKTKNITWEHTLYGVAILLALMVRLFHLGAAPLTDFEAGWALKALHLSGATGAQAAYVVLTSWLLDWFGSGNTVARLWPALAGSLLPLLAWLWRERIGREAALVAAFGLALDPALVAVSRTAGGPMPALVFTLFALTAFWQGRPIGLGIFGGLVLLSGRYPWNGLLALGLAVGLTVFLDNPRGELPVRWNKARISTALYAAGGTLLIAGTLFFRHPMGLAGVGEGLITFFSGWTHAAGVPLGWMVLSLPDSPLALVFGLIGGGMALRYGLQHGRFLLLWALTALLVGLAYPAGQVFDLIWVLIPLWGLAGLGIAYLLNRAQFRSSEVWVQFFVSLVLLAFVGLELISIGKSVPGDRIFWLRWLMVVSALLLLALSTWLMASGWSADTARHGLVLGLLVFFGIGSLSSLSRAETSQLLWQPEPWAGQQVEMLTTLQRVSEWHTGRRDALPLVMMGERLPSLEWALRGFNVRWASNLEHAELPEAIIRPAEMGDLQRPAAYRGQDFVWQVSPLWNGNWPINPLNFILNKSLPRQTRNWVVWVRGDMFPGGTLSLQPENTPTDQSTPLEDPLNLPNQ